MTNTLDTHTNPAILRSVRHTIPATDTMQKYYGEIKRNADAAWVMCGNDSNECNGKIEGCPFRFDGETVRVCELNLVMGLMRV